MRGIIRVWAAITIMFAAAPAFTAEPQGLLSFVFGPSSQETARQSARAAAAVAHRWLQTSGNEVRVRRAGQAGVQQFDSRLPARDLEQAFMDVAAGARDADPPSFLISLDAAAQDAALHSGTRVVAAVLNAPPFSSDGERTLEHLVDICRNAAVRVVVLDIAENVKNTPKTALAALASRTGGLWISQGGRLEGGVATTAAANEPPEPAPGTPKGEESAQAALPAPGAIPEFEIPVHVRFMRVSGTGTVSNKITNHTADFGQTMSVGDPGNSAMSVGSSALAYEANDANQPMQGLITVESPLNALKFDVDDNGGIYLARARLTVTVRNAKGATVWTARKEINVRGPARKLDIRRQGSILFMRGVGLPGQGPYTMEARIEDLTANTSGVAREPVRTGSNAPGLVASDAVVVRPFKGAADKFEADQVFSYEGEALAPILNPVYRAEDPINLQVYLVLYPDIHGALPDLSMEIQHEGRVVARMPLQFKSGLAKQSMEGSSSKIGGRVDTVVGGQAKEFPYLVDLKGAKFSPGNYEGIISIRQGKSLIKRTVTFRVEGKAPVVMQTASAAKIAGPAEDTEEAAVVLPEIEPATVDSSGLRMGRDEQKRVWDEAAKSALGYLSHLPNFRCVQETHRFTAPIKSPNQLKEADSFKDELMYEDGKERYQTVEINGMKPENTTMKSTGIHSRNEFGTMLSGLFDPEVGATYKWSGHAMAMGVLCDVFEVEVSKAKTNFVLHYGGTREPVGYTGRVFIEEDTGLVRRLTIEGVGLPKDFGLQSPAFSLDYGMVRIGTQDYLLPLRSVLQLRHTKSFVRNETVFRGYRKFEAESDIKFEN